MLLIGLTSLLIAIPLYSSSITPSAERPITAIQLTRITTIILLFSAALSLNSLYVQSIGTGLGLYSGLFHVTTVTQLMEVFLYTVGAFILAGWAVVPDDLTSKAGHSGRPSQRAGLSSGAANVAEYPLIVLFTTIGASFLISSSDLVSMYLSIELQSFAVYILAAIYRNSESATSAGLKYFLLGALSSALILLGSRIIYANTGLTSFEGIYMITSVSLPITDGLTSFAGHSVRSIDNGVVLGIVLIAVGFLFKVAAAPFHNWAPDVYDGVPTIVTTWLTVMPKISIFVFLTMFIPGFQAQGLLEGTSRTNWLILDNLLLTTAFLSLVIGTVVGLAQYRIKRLLAYSTISHVGFMLLALSVNSEESMTSLLFYLMQYSLTNLNAFFIVLALGYMVNTAEGHRRGSDLSLISQLKGQFQDNPVLGLSLALCLFSMAGIPPLVGFFAKYRVLYSAMENGFYFLAVIGILASVVSAAYYLRVVRVIHFDPIINATTPESAQVADTSATQGQLTSIHSYVIAVLTLFVLLFMLSPSLLLNSSNLVALSLFTA